jgi:tetratricopeptide (TPR) repeat protein
MAGNEAFRQCVEAFAGGDYDRCAQQAWALVQEGATLHNLQLLLISLQRLGRKDVVDKLGPQVLAATAGSPWDQSLFRLTLRQAHPQEAMKQATDDRQYCQVLFYVGAQMLTLGAAEEANRTLAACVAQQCDCLERRLAQYELARGTTASASVSTGDVEHQVEELNGRVLRLFQQGHLAQAVSVAEQALDLACQHLGEEHPQTANTLDTLAALLQAQGDSAAARPYLEKVLEINRRVLGENHPDTAKSLDNLGLLLQAMGELASARPY